MIHGRGPVLITVTAPIDAVVDPLVQCPAFTRGAVGEKAVNDRGVSAAAGAGGSLING